MALKRTVPHSSIVASLIPLLSYSQARISALQYPDRAHIDRPKAMGELSSLTVREQPAPSDDSDEPEYPEGGRQAWLVVLGAWCAVLPAAGLLNSVGILQAWTREHMLQDYSESSVGWIYSTYGLLMIGAGAQTGPIFDAHGVHCVIIPGSIGMVAALLLFSFSHEYYQLFLSFGILGGLSASTLFTPSISCVGHWFQHRRGFATGVCLTSAGFGGAIFPVIVLFAAPSIGFAWAIRIFALLTAILCSCACLLMRTRLPRNKGGSKLIDLKALMDLPFGLAAGGTFLMECAIFVTYTFIPSYARHVGVSDTLSWILVMLVNLASILGRTIPGLLADKLGRFNVMVASLCLCSILTFTVWLCARGSLAALICYSVAVGCFSGTAFSIEPVCISQICKIEDYGKRSGTAFFIGSLGTLASIPAGGAILDAGGGEYQGVILFGAALYLAASGLYGITRGVCTGWGWRAVF